MTAATPSSPLTPELRALIVEKLARALVAKWRADQAQRTTERASA